MAEIIRDVGQGASWPTSIDDRSYNAGWLAAIKHVELQLLRKLERPDVRKSDDEWNDVISALQQVRELFSTELAT